MRVQCAIPPGCLGPFTAGRGWWGGNHPRFLRESPSVSRSWGSGGGVQCLGANYPGGVPKLWDTISTRSLGSARVSFLKIQNSKWTAPSTFRKFRQVRRRADVPLRVFTNSHM